MLNNFGLGMVFAADDQSGPGNASAQSNLMKTQKAAEATSVSMKQIGQGFEKIGATATIAGGILAAGLGVAVSEASKFQYGVASVATEADAAKLPATVIADLAKQMATTYGGDLSTQIKAAYQGVAAGADTAAKSMALLDGANRLAIAGQTTQEIALLGITKVINNYGLSFDKATDVADAFFVAVKGGQTTVGELGSAIGEVAAVGKNAGLSMEELIGALGTAATLGKDTATSAAQLKAALSSVVHPTADAAAEAQRLGIHFNAAELRSKGLVGFLKEITGSSKFTADSMGKLFGSLEAASFVTELTSNNMSALNDMMTGMKDKAGGSQKAFETMSATLQQASSVLKANLQVALVDVGTAFLPVITLGVQFVTSIVRGFNGLSDPTKKAVAVLASVVAAVLIVTGVVAGLVGVLLTVELPIAAVGIALAAMVGVMEPLIVAGGVLTAVIFGLKNAFDENVGGLRTTIIPIFEKVRLTWQALSQAFSQGGFSGAVRDELNKGNEPIKNFAIGVYTFAMRISNFFTSIQSGFTRASEMAGPTFAKFSVALDHLVSALGGLVGGKNDPNKAASAFDKMGDAGKTVGAVLERIAEVVVTGFTYAIQWVTGFIETAEKMGPTFAGVWAAAKSLWGSLGDLFDALGQLVGAFSSTSDGAEQSGGSFAGMVDALVWVIGTALQVASVMIQILVPAIRGVAAVASLVGQIFHAVFDNMKADIMLLLGVVAKASDALTSLTSGKKTTTASDLVASLAGTGTKSNAGPGGVSTWLVPATSQKSPGGVGGTQTAAPALAGGPGVASGSNVTTTPMSIPSANGLTAQTSPAIASAGQSQGATLTPDQLEASMTRAMRAQPPGPPQTIVVPVMLDGQKLAEATAQTTSSNAVRSFQRTPSPQG